MPSTKIKDTGSRRIFKTGAQRDRGEEKGLPSLVCPHFAVNLAILMKENESNGLINIRQKCYYLLSLKDVDDLLTFSLYIAKLLCEYRSYIYAMKQLHLQLEQGAKKYDSRNWEKGMPLIEFFNSLVRHIDALINNEDDENHYGAAMFNIMGFYHTLLFIKDGLLPEELNNLPQFGEMKWKSLIAES